MGASPTRRTLQPEATGAWGGDRRSNFREGSLKLADLGLTEKQSFLWQKLAALAEAAFLQRLKDAKTAAVAAIEMTAKERQVEKCEAQGRRAHREVRNAKPGSRDREKAQTEFLGEDACSRN